jgi:hypothetical protein
LQVVVDHEWGHAWDYMGLSPTKIAEWCAARGCDPAGFYSGGASGRSSNGTPWNAAPGAEDWSSAWSACHGGSYPRDYLGFGPPTAAQCALQNTLTGY